MRGVVFAHSSARWRARYGKVILASVTESAHGLGAFGKLSFARTHLAVEIAQTRVALAVAVSQEIFAFALGGERPVWRKNGTRRPRAHARKRISWSALVVAFACARDVSARTAEIALVVLHQTFALLYLTARLPGKVLFGSKRSEAVGVC